MGKKVKLAIGKTCTEKDSEDEVEEYSGEEDVKEMDSNEEDSEEVELDAEELLGAGEDGEDGESSKRSAQGWRLLKRRRCWMMFCIANQACHPPLCSGKLLVCSLRSGVMYCPGGGGVAIK